MADDLFFFDMDLGNWHDGRTRTDSNFEELYPDLSNSRASDDAVDFRADESAPAYGQPLRSLEPATACPVELKSNQIRPNFATGACDAPLGEHLFSAGHTSIPQVKETPYANFDPADIVDDDADQWTTLMQKMTFVQDFVDTNQNLSSHREFSAQPESPPPHIDSATCDVALTPEHSEQPYNQLLYDCLMSALHQEMRLFDIYEWMKANTTKVHTANETGWKNSIRHNLSMNPAFKQGCRSSESAGIKHMWMLTDDAIRHGYVQSTTRYRGRSARRPSGKGIARNRAPTERRGGSKKIRWQDAEAPLRHSRNDSLYSTHQPVSPPRVSSWQTPLLLEPFVHEEMTPDPLGVPCFDHDQDLYSTTQTTPSSFDTKSIPATNQCHPMFLPTVSRRHADVGLSDHAPSSSRYGSPPSAKSSQYGSLENLPIYPVPDQSTSYRLMKPSPTPYQSAMDAAAMVCEHGDFEEICPACRPMYASAGTFNTCPFPAYAMLAQAQDRRLWLSSTSSPCIGDSIQSFQPLPEKQQLTVACHVAADKPPGQCGPYNDGCQSQTSVDSADTMTGVEIFSGYEADDEAFSRYEPYDVFSSWYADLPSDNKHGPML